MCSPTEKNIFIPFKCTVKVLNRINSNAKLFDLVLSKIHPHILNMTLLTFYSMSDNPQNTISKTSIKYYNINFSVHTKAIICIQLKTDDSTQIKLRENTINRMINYYISFMFTSPKTKLSQLEIINITTYPIVNKYFTKFSMEKENVYRLLVIPSEVFMTKVCKH